MISPRKYMKKIVGISVKKDLSRTVARKSSTSAPLKTLFMATNRPKPDIIDRSKVFVSLCTVTIKTSERTTETVTTRFLPQKILIFTRGERM